MIEPIKFYHKATNKNSINYKRETAFKNVLSSLNIVSTFPGQVFSVTNLEFMFFESDRMFVPSFASTISEFLSCEGSACCCLLNFDRTTNMIFSEAATIFFDPAMTGAQYDAKLRDGGGATAWLFNMDRYGCSSDGGIWTMYCEKGNDVAVAAFQGQNTVERFSSPLKKLNAQTIDDLVDQGPNAPFPFNCLTLAWRASLQRLYSNKRQ